MKLIVAMIVALVGGFLLASKIDQTVAVEKPVFPKFASLIRNFVASIFLISSVGVACVALASVLPLLFGGG